MSGQRFDGKDALAGSVRQTRQWARRRYVVVSACGRLLLNGSGRGADVLVNEVGIATHRPSSRRNP